MSAARTLRYLPCAFNRALPPPAASSLRNLSTMPPKERPSVLSFADAKLEDSREPGKFVKLSDLYDDKPLAIAFLRR